MQEMERLQAKGEVTEEVLHAMEEDMTGKVRISCYMLFLCPSTITLHYRSYLPLGGEPVSKLCKYSER